MTDCVEKQEERDIKDLIVIECDKLAALLCEKNRAYGSEVFNPPFLAPGVSSETGTLIRMGDKIRRLKNLLHEGVEPPETIDDTVRDLAGYCVLFLVQTSLIMEKEICSTTNHERFA